MYSLVLMAAVSGSPDVSGADTPAAVTVAAPVSYGCGCGGAVVSYGCSAPVAYSCYGSSACYGRSYGCGMAVAMPAYKYGCGAVAYSSGCYGSCTGVVASASCMGTASCYGSSCHGEAAPAKHGFLGIRDRMQARRMASASAGCMGTVSYGCMGSSCYGSSCHGAVASYGCSGGCYGSAVWGAPAYTTVVGEKVISEKVVTPAATGGAAMPEVKKTTTDPKGTTTDPKGTTTDPKKTGGNEEGANIKFTLPANAKLFVDGRPTSGEGTERAFFTPPLTAGQKFFYDVKAELVVDGKVVTEEKRVIVAAGDDLRESFPKLFAAAGNPASVASK